LITAIRLFISVVLFREDDKKNIIKQNTKNIIECMKEKDLWKNKDIQDENFEVELLEIKSLNIKIYEILWFYLYLTNNKDEEFEKEVENLKNKNKPEESPKWNTGKKVGKGGKGGKVGKGGKGGKGGKSGKLEK